MKRLISLIIAAPLLVACGSDSDSDSDSPQSNQPNLPTLQLSSSGNNSTSANLGIASGMITGATSALAAYGDASYSSSGSTETWSYSVDGLTATLEYTDGATQDTWELTLDGTDGTNTYDDWLAWQIVEQDVDDSFNMRLYAENSADLEAEVAAAEGRVQYNAYESGQLDSTFVVIEESATAGRMLTQEAGEQINAFIWNGDQLATYFNCGNSLSAAETGDLSALCSGNAANAM